jgi:threonine dehydratase
MPITLSEIRQANALLRERVQRTPLVYSSSFSRMVGARVYLKLENLQKTGSFKLRGASHKIQRNLAAIGPAGVVAASAGNHAQGVALAARQEGLAATIVMPLWASISKQEATRGYGGEVVLHGANLEESLEKARELAAAGRTFIHPYEDRDVILGQGTVGLEILEDVAAPDYLLVPVGGGGLIAGVAAAARAMSPGTRVIGVQAAACPSAAVSLREGKPMRVEARKSIADGLAVKQVGWLNFQLLQETVDQVVLVDEEQIAAALLVLLERKKVLAEGAGAVCLAALLHGAVDIRPGSTVVLVVSGGNVDSSLLGRILRQGLVRNQRVVRLSVRLDDIPGALAGLLTRIAELQANVLQIDHDRSLLDLPIYVSRVQLELETRGPEHVDEILRELQRSGYPIEYQPS